tara:strand:- start:25105 stop:25593 length:489 start_codon:yes stop_codon:yes gene_type:complete
MAHNGRVNIIGVNTGDIFSLYDKIPVQQKSTQYRNALTGTWNNNMLSTAFFSSDNIRIIQNSIKKGVYSASNGNFVISDQDEDTLKIIMRSIFLQNSKNSDNNIKNQIIELNDKVVRYAVPQIYGEAEGYIRYKHDVSTLATPIERPLSTYHNNELEFKKFF